MKFTTTLILCVIFFNIVQSQEGCLTHKIHDNLFNSDTNYVKNIALKNNLNTKITSSEEAVTIPLVVHVIHLGENEGIGTNISTDQIKGAISKLNQNFKSANGIDIGIQFCLARIDPNGQPTNGINRLDGRVIPNYQSQGIAFDGFGVDIVDIKDLIQWPEHIYYNIHVVNKIEGASAFAYYPQYFPFFYDGTVIEAFFMSNLFSTLTHELGHAFNLIHTFEEDGDGDICPPNKDCTRDGDLICDTSPHKRADCFAANPCVSGDTNWNRTRRNFMSYCIFTDRFTPLQKERMRNAAFNLGSRTTLWANESVCTPFPDIDGSVSISYPIDTSINEICGESDIQLEFELENRGLNVIRNFDIHYNINNYSNIASFNTNLSFGESASFTLPPYKFDSAQVVNIFKIEIDNINGLEDEFTSNNAEQVSFGISDTCLTTNLSDYIANTIKIFPLPNTSGLLYISNISEDILLSIELYDVLGKTVLKKENLKNNNIIDIQNLSGGSYYAIFKSATLQFSKVILKL